MFPLANYTCTKTYRVFYRNNMLCSVTTLASCSQKLSRLGKCLVTICKEKLRRTHLWHTCIKETKVWYSHTYNGTSHIPNINVISCIHVYEGKSHKLHHHMYSDLLHFINGERWKCYCDTVRLQDSKQAITTIQMSSAT